MNIYVNINGKTRYFKSREDADKALGKKPADVSNGNKKQNNKK